MKLAAISVQALQLHFQKQDQMREAAENLAEMITPVPVEMEEKEKVSRK